MALIENIQRENLNPLEEALGIKRLIDEFAMTHEKAAAAVGRSRTAVTNLLRLLTLASPVQEMLMQGKIDMGHARALIGLDAAKQTMLAQKIALDNLSVREVEHLVKQQAPTASKTNTRATNSDKDVQRIEENLADKIGASVKIQAKANGSGMLKIQYGSLDQLDEIIAKLSR
jgi:ParB family chromosome partitioning protein